jgi:hypothetical protein
MLLTVMIVCAVGAIVLFASNAVDDLLDGWTRPRHHPIDKDLRHRQK